MNTLSPEEVGQFSVLLGITPEDILRMNPYAVRLTAATAEMKKLNPEFVPILSEQQICCLFPSKER